MGGQAYRIVGFPDRIEGRFLAKLVTTDRAKAERSAAYYRRFYGGLRDIQVVDAP